MKLAIMQPYFFPYIGYFQLIAVADCFIIYDNIKYTKKGWINRNRILCDGRETTVSLPLKKAADRLTVGERELATAFERDRLINQIAEAYRKSPQFSTTMPLVERVLRCTEQNLFRFIHNALLETCAHLGLQTTIRLASSVAIDHQLKGEQKVIALCKASGATTYINAIGGLDLYSRGAFAARGVELKFLRSRPLIYRQTGEVFVPWLSIIDVMMFNPLDKIRNEFLANYEFV